MNVLMDQFDERLDALVGRTDASSATPVDPAVETLVRAAERVKGALFVEIDPEIRSQHLQAIVDHARTRRLASGARRRSLKSLVLKPFAALIMAAMIAVPATSAAASGALPGDSLYGAKLAKETLALVLERDLANDTQLHLEFAEKRLSEIVKIERLGRSTGIERALANRESHLAAARQGLASLEAAGRGNSELSASLDHALTQHLEVLSSLAGKANCDSTDPEAGSPQCKGLLNAIEKSARSQGGGPPDGSPSNTNRPTQLPEPADVNGSSNKGRSPENKGRQP